MKVYDLQTMIHHPLAIVDIKDGSGRIFDYFLLGKGDGNFLNYAKPLAAAQPGYTPAKMTKTDYLNASIGVPVFSQRFKEQVGGLLTGDMELVRCTVNCNGQDFVCYMGRILTVLPLIDPEKSVYRKLTDGTLVLSGAAYYETFDKSFLIARDKGSPVRWVVSEDFKQLIERHQLNIGFMAL